MQATFDPVPTLREREACERILQISLRKPTIPSTELAEAIPPINDFYLRKALAKLSEKGLVRISADKIVVSDRLGVAEFLLMAGTSPETVSNFLNWREFEQFCSQALEKNGFAVRPNLRFTQGGKRYQIDVVAVKKPYLLFIDCKHWRPGKGSGFKVAARRQEERMHAALNAESTLSKNLMGSFCEPRRIALIVSLTDSTIRSIKATPIVPIFRFNSFLLELDQFWDEFRAAQVREQ